MKGIPFLNILDRVPPTILNTLSVISSIMTILGYFMTVFIFFFPDIWEKMEQIGFIRVMFPYGWLVISVFAFVIIAYKCSVYYHDSDYRLYNDSYEMHRLTHKYRDMIVSFTSRIETKDISLEEVAMEVQSFCKMCLDSMTKLVSEITHEEVYGCIKLVDATDESTPRTLTNQTVTDFARSSNTPANRLTRPPKPHLICQNTDFMELMDYNNIRNQFYQPDLIEYEKQLVKDDHTYKNSSQDWRLKYKSTVVVPIQIENMLLSIEESEAYHIIGFVCLDSQKADTFKLKFKIPICNLVKAYADLLYCVLYQYSKWILELSNDSYIEAYIEKKYAITLHKNTET